ncbi:MAG: DUF6456 domain-containing protein [Pseudomonadota bacterium]
MGSSGHHGSDFGPRLPNWVPSGALHYIAHTENGAPIRAIAREAGCHASTILRQIRKVEMRRDDPLVDAALRKLGAATADIKRPNRSKRERVARPAQMQPPIPTDETLTREAVRVLRRLCETGAVLAVAEGLEKAVVVRDGVDGSNMRTAVVGASVAQAMALKDWIVPSQTGRITRYQITTAGRVALGQLLESLGMPGDPAEGFAEDQASFDVAGEGDDNAGSGRSRYSVGESPLSALARRRDKDGKRFLEDALVQSGERLREDFELAQMDGVITQNWDQFIKDGVPAAQEATDAPETGPAAARARVKAALRDLGPGLSDVVLRCCCYLEGLETTEKRLGWSARSGKVVLRIALMRLKRHYDETIGPGGAMIG